jgi:hypothetical protein
MAPLPWARAIRNGGRRFGAAALLMAFTLAGAGGARAGILGCTSYVVDLTQAKAAAQKARWADPKVIRVTANGLGWGKSGDEGSRDFWLETTEPIGLGVSWRPPMAVSIRAAIDGPGTGGLLYVRYSCDARHWSTWQIVPEAGPAKVGDTSQKFQGTVRVPYREMAVYQDMRLKYARREDVAWSSDEEALAKDIVRRDPKYFAKSKPFIGYVQFLYEAQLHGGQRVKALKFEMSWAVGGIHQIPKKKDADKNRDGPWRFKVK